MANPDAYFLFTNILLDETIGICIDSLYKDYENNPKIPKFVFQNLLNVVTNTNSINKFMVLLWGLQ